MTTEKSIVLLVEDSETLRKMVGIALEEQGHKVLLAADGAEALTQMRTHDPEIIVLDINLPDIDGFELCKRFKSDPCNHAVPVVMMTSLDQAGFEIMAIDAGADDFVTKPVDPMVLDARIEMLVSRLRRERFENVLTGLPGAVLSEQRLGFFLERGKSFAVVVVDIDGFRAFNQRFGYIRGDLLLKHTAQLITETCMFEKCAEPFIGHRGADDFLFVCEPDVAERTATELVEAFDSSVLDFYEDEDREREGFILIDRMGESQEYGPLTMSCSVVSSEKRHFSSVMAMLDEAEDLLKYAKSQEGSFVAVDRRSDDSEGSPEDRE